MQFAVGMAVTLGQPKKRSLQSEMQSRMRDLESQARSENEARSQQMGRELEERNRELEMLRSQVVDHEAQVSRLNQAQARIRDLESLCKMQQQNSMTRIQGYSTPSSSRRELHHDTSGASLGSGKAGSARTPERNMMSTSTCTQHALDLLARIVESSVLPKTLGPEPQIHLPVHSKNAQSIATDTRLSRSWRLS